MNAEVLDKIVLNRLCEQLLTAERVQAIVAEVAAKREAGNDNAAISLGQLKEQRAKTGKKLANLINALAEGIVEATETFKATVKATEADAEHLASLVEAQERLLETRLKAITLEEAASVATKLRDKLLPSTPSLKKESFVPLWGGWWCAPMKSSLPARNRASPRS